MEEGKLSPNCEPVNTVLEHCGQLNSEKTVTECNFTLTQIRKVFGNEKKKERER